MPDNRGWTAEYADGVIAVRHQVNPRCARHFLSAVGRCTREKTSEVVLDFTEVTRAYPNGMIPIICTVDWLKRTGRDVRVVLPRRTLLRNLFLNTNWAHLLCPAEFSEQNAAHDRHLTAHRFSSAEQQFAVVNDFLDVVLRNMSVPRSVVSGLEWSINEITDNVLNHSNSQDGGLVQVTTYPSNHRVAFAVGDSGVGILHTLREAIPTLEDDAQAIGEAVKSGVTRGAHAGQGNGLAGTLRIASGSGGGFAVTSGRGTLNSFAAGTQQHQNPIWHRFRGTLVCADFRTDTDFTIEEALVFDGYPAHIPVDVIEMNYECDDGHAFKLRLADETTGFGNRNSGRQLRTKTLNILSADSRLPIEIDWSGIPVVSSSFADEFMGRLFLEMGAMAFTARVRNHGMEPLIRGLLDKAIAQRLQQAADDE